MEYWAFLLAGSSSHEYATDTMIQGNHGASVTVVKK